MAEDILIGSLWIHRTFGAYYIYRVVDYVGSRFISIEHYEGHSVGLLIREQLECYYSPISEEDAALYLLVRLP